jgi:hypothetical protein
VPADVAGVLKSLKQNVEVLAGLVGLDKIDRAIKYGEISISDADKLQSAQIVAAPTQTDYNNLQADVDMLRTRYNYLAAALRGESVGG